jgi:pimeloyl-ACP methyl ester carboxylesterase
MNLPATLSLTVLTLLPTSAPAAETTLDNMKIHYLTYGTGDEALVFIHGWTCDSTFWRMQASLYEHRRSILIDLPGHGRSDKPDIPYTMDLFARAVDAVMTAAHVRKATLIGHSMGTPVAIQFLRMHPDKVAGLVIVDGFVPQPPKSEKALAQAKERAQSYRAPDYKAAALRTLEYMFTTQTPPDLRAEIQSKMLSAPPYVMASAVEGMATMEPVTEAWPHLRTQAMMVKRANSAGYQDYLKAHFRLLGYREFDNAGHFVMMEQPDAFNETLREFLDGK